MTPNAHIVTVTLSSRAAACQCGWTCPSGRAVQEVKRQGRVHLRDKHGAIHIQAAVRTLSGIDERLLSKSERTRYEELTQVANGDAAVTRQLGLRSRWRDHKMSLAVSAAWLLVSLALFILAMEEDDIPEPHPDPLFWIFLFVLLGGATSVVVVIGHEIVGWRRGLVPDYLGSIGFHERSAVTTVRDTDDDRRPHYWATGNYDPERYYRETRGWSKEYREYVKDAYGDLDTYNANSPD